MALLARDSRWLLLTRLIKGRGEVSKLIQTRGSEGCKYPTEEREKDGCNKMVCWRADAEKIRGKWRASKCAYLGKMKGVSGFPGL